MFLNLMKLFEKKLLKISEGCSSATSNKIVKIFWFGVLIRILLMPFSGHADFYYTFAFTYPFFLEGVLDPYSYKSEFPEYIPFYQPFCYYIIGLWGGFLELVIGNEQSQWIFSMWENVANRDAGKVLRFPGAENKFLLIFFWKMLFFLADFILFLMLVRSGEQNETKQKFLVKLWAFNPIILYSVFMMGQLDILPTAIVFSSVWLYGRTSNLRWSAFLMSCAVPFKFYPLILFPFFFFLGKSWKERWTILFYAAIPLLAVYVPIGMHSGGKVFILIKYALESASTRSPVLLQLSVLLVIFKAGVYLLLNFHAASIKEKTPPANLLESYVFITLFLLLLVPVVVHYYVWLVPFLMLFIVRNPKFEKPVYFMMFLIFVAVITGRSLSLGIFAPIHPELFMSFPSWMDINYALFPSKIITSISTIIVISIIIWIIIHELKRLLENYPIKNIRDHQS